MKLEEFIEKAAKTPYFPSWRFKIPDDIYGQVSVVKDYEDTVEKLTSLNNYWTKEGVSTDWREGKHTLEKVWDNNTYKWVERIVVEITMVNTEIKKFRPAYELD